MGERIRWGILGTGKIARILAEALTHTETGELVAVGSRSAERARALAQAFSVEGPSGTYATVIEDPTVDLVYVATHHSSHAVLATRAALAGKHVLCEKPLAVDLDDASGIVEAARRSDVFLMEAFAYRCHPQTDRLVEILRSEAIGEIRMIDAVFGYDAGPRPKNYLFVRELGGGSILDVGCYTTSMALLVARIAGGGKVVDPVDVVGAAYLGASTGVDHAAAATLTFEGGLIARVACAINADLDSSLRIYGSEGRITVGSPWLPGRIGSKATIVVDSIRFGRDAIEIDLGAGVYAIEAEAVGEFVRVGERSPAAMSWEESLANMRALDRWRSSIGSISTGHDAAAGGTDVLATHGTFDRWRRDRWRP